MYKTKKKNYKDCHFSLLVFALTLYHEARGEGVTGMEYVSDVIINRCLHKYRKYKTCVDSLLFMVLLEPWQFSCWNGKTPSYQMAEKCELDQEIKIALAAAIRLSKWISNPITYKVVGDSVIEVTEYPWIHTPATHYCTIDSSPSWEKKLKYLGVYKNHKFYRDFTINPGGK